MERYAQAADPGSCREAPAARYNPPMPVRAAGLWIFALGSLGCGLRLDRVTAEVAPGGIVEIEGAGFSPATRFELVASVDVALQNGEVSAGRATATVPRAAPAGIYDLRAEEAGAIAELPRSVRVISGGLEVHFLDVGQGDATLVVAPGGQTLLIDGGPRSAGPVVRAALRELGRDRLDAVLLSHTDADHLGGLVEVLQGDDGEPGTDDDLVPSLRLAGADDGACTTEVCADLRRLSAWPFSVPDVGELIEPLSTDGVEATVVAVDGDVGGGRVAGVDDENERSLVVQLSFAGRSILVTGDLTGGGAGEADLESALAARTGPIDVLRASHHGSATSSAPAALAAWQPRAVVLSLGTDNPYCHPAPEVVSRLGGLGVPLYATGSGILLDAARCGGETPWPAQARPGLGTVTLTVLADGALALAGDPL